MSPERFCGCGNKLGLMNRSLICYECKQLFENSLVRLHSCVPNGLHDPVPVSCSCRKFLDFQQAKEFIRIGRAVDLKTRTSNFFQRAIIEKSRLKNPPISSVGARVAIERVVINSAGNRFDEAEITRMKQTVAEDQAWRKIEQASKIAVEHQLAIEEQAKLIVFVDEKEFEEAKRRSWGRPDLFVIKDERTSCGRDVGSSRFDSSAGIDVETDESDKPIETEIEELADAGLART